MPSCSFYASRGDVASIVEVILEESSCRIWESYSSINRETRELTDATSVLSAYDSANGPLKLNLALYAPEMRGVVVFDRIDLREDKKAGD